MKKNKVISSFFIGFCLMILFAGTTTILAQSMPERVEVPLTDPAKPAYLQAKVMIGSITVTGYNGKVIVLESKTEPAPDQGPQEKEADEKAKGMTLIQNTRSSLVVEEENNNVTVKVSNYHQKVNLDFKVPFNTSLKLKGLNDGFIEVRNVSGELEVNHLNGPITMENVSGTVIAHTLNGEVKVTFAKVNADKPMSFSTLNGDIDVTFPKNVKFNLKMKSERGDIYSDFQLKSIAGPSPVTQVKKRGKFRLEIDKSIYAELNGGGEEIQFKTFNGNIYIREKK